VLTNSVRTNPVALEEKKIGTANISREFGIWMTFGSVLLGEIVLYLHEIRESPWNATVFTHSLVARRAGALSLFVIKRLTISTLLSVRIITSFQDFKNLGTTFKVSRSFTVSLRTYLMLRT
jgi:hypothetical protein